MVETLNEPVRVKGEEVLGGVTEEEVVFEEDLVVGAGPVWGK